MKVYNKKNETKWIKNDDQYDIQYFFHQKHYMIFNIVQKIKERKLNRKQSELVLETESRSITNPSIYTIENDFVIS
jgi:hypothetical protein